MDPLWWLALLVVAALALVAAVVDGVGRLGPRRRRDGTRGDGRGDGPGDGRGDGRDGGRGGTRGEDGGR